MCNSIGGYSHAMPLYLERSKRDNDNIIMEKMQKKLVSVMHRVLNRNLLSVFSSPIFSLSSKIRENDDSWKYVCVTVFG